MVAVAVSELVATEERVSRARAAVKAASLREQGENRDTQTRHQGDWDRGGVAPTRACRGVSCLQKITQTSTEQLKVQQRRSLTQERKKKKESCCEWTLKDTPHTHSDMGDTSKTDAGIK